MSYKKFTYLSALISTLFLFSCAQTKKQLKSMSVKVKFVKGQVKVLSQRAELKKARLGQSLKLGDKIFTKGNSSIELLVDQLGVVKVGENSSLEISTITKSKQQMHASLKLNGGSVFSAVQKMKKSDQFTIKTPTAVAGVRGTSFITEVTGSTSGIYPSGLRILKKIIPKTKVSVLSGKVVLNDNFGSEVVLDKLSQIITQGKQKLARKAIVPISPQAIQQMKNMLVMKSKEALSYKFLVRELSTVLPNDYGNANVDAVKRDIQTRQLFKPSTKLKVKKKRDAISEGLDDDDLKLKTNKKW